MCLSIGDGRDSGPPFAHLICAFSVVFLSVILYITTVPVLQLCNYGNCKIMKPKIEYLIFILFSLIFSEYCLFGSWILFCGGVQWSITDWNSGKVSFFILFHIWPAFLLGTFFRLVLLSRWKIPAYGWFLPLILSGIAAFPLCRKLNMAAYCIIAMIVLPVIDFLAFHKAERRKARIADSKDIK